MLEVLSAYTHAHDLFQRLQCCFGPLAWIPHSLQQRRDGLIDRLGAHAMLHSVESPSSGGAHGGRPVHQGRTNRRDDGIFVISNNFLIRRSPTTYQGIRDAPSLPRGYLHHIGKCKTSSFLRPFVRRRDSLLEDRDDLAKDSLAILAAKLSKGTRSGLRLISKHLSAI